MGPTRKNLLSHRDKYFSKLVLTKIIIILYIFEYESEEKIIMSINLRQDAPDQTDIIDPKKLSEEVEKLKSIQANIKLKEDQIKDLKEDEKHFSCLIIPKLMEDMNLKKFKSYKMVLNLQLKKFIVPL